MCQIFLMICLHAVLFLPVGNKDALETKFFFVQNAIPLSSLTATTSPGLGGRKRQKSSWLLTVVNGVVTVAALTNEEAITKRLVAMRFFDRSIIIKNKKKVGLCWLKKRKGDLFQMSCYL